jgi:hypothetical protein
MEMHAIFTDCYEFYQDELVLEDPHHKELVPRAIIRRFQNRNGDAVFRSYPTTVVFFEGSQKGYDPPFVLGYDANSVFITLHNVRKAW